MPVMSTVHLLAHSWGYFKAKSSQLVQWNQLTHWCRDKMDAIYQTTFSIAFSWMKIYKFRLRFHWNLFLGVQLTIFQHWFRWWLGTDRATSHYLKQWWLVYWRIYASLICVTRPQWVKTLIFVSPLCFTTDGRNAGDIFMGGHRAFVMIRTVSNYVLIISEIWTLCTMHVIPQTYPSPHGYSKSLCPLLILLFKPQYT